MAKHNVSGFYNLLEALEKAKPGDNIHFVGDCSFKKEVEIVVDRLRFTSNHGVRLTYKERRGAFKVSADGCVFEGLFFICKFS